MSARLPFRLLLRCALIAILAAASRGVSAAQTPFIGPRATAMGGAATAVADDGTALWTNPAGLARDPRTDLELFGSAVATDRGDFRRTIDALSGVDLQAVAANPSEILRIVDGLSRLAAPGTGIVGSGAAGLVFAWKGLALGIGDLAYAGVYPSLDLVRVLPGNDPASGIRFNQTAVRSAGLEAREARLAYSRAFFGKTLLVGATGRYILGRTYYVSESVFDADLGNPLSAVRDALKKNARETGRFAFDVGAMVNLLGKVRIGAVSTAVNAPTFAVKHDPADPSLAGAPDSLKLPRTLRAGAAVQPIGAVTIAVDGDLVQTRTLVPGGDSRQLSAGAEVRLPLFTLRAGAFRDFAAPDPHWAYSAGFGLGLPWVSVNGAVVLSTYHGLSLSSSNQRDVGAAVDARVRF